MYHFVLLDIYVEGGEAIVDLIDLGGVVNHRHLSLLDIAQLLSEQKLYLYCDHGKNLFQISPSIFRRPSIPNIAQKLIAHTGRKAVQDSTCRSFPQARKSVFVDSGAA